MALVDLRRARQRVARMEVERHVELLALGPEIPVAAVVEIHHRVLFFYLREPVHQRAAEAQLFHAADQLARGSVGVLHGKRREALEAPRALLHFSGEKVVGAPRDRARAR